MSRPSPALDPAANTAQNACYALRVAVRELKQEMTTHLMDALSEGASTIPHQQALAEAAQAMTELHRLAEASEQALLRHIEDGLAQYSQELDADTQRILRRHSEHVG